MSETILYPIRRRYIVPEKLSAQPGMEEDFSKPIDYDVREEIVFVPEDEARRHSW